MSARRKSQGINMPFISSISRWASSLSVTTRLVGGFGLLLIMTLLIGGAGIGGLYRVNNNVNDIVGFTNAKLAAAQVMVRAVNEQQLNLFKLVVATEAKSAEAAHEAIKYQTGQYSDNKAGLMDIMTLAKPTDLETGIVEKIQKDEADTSQLISKNEALFKEEKTEEALKMLNEQVSPAIGKWVQDLDELVSIEQHLNDASAASAMKDYTVLKYFSLSCLGVALAMGALLTFAISRSVTRELGGEPRDVTHVVNEVAAGNLAQNIHVRDGDSHSIMAAMKGTMLNLADIVRSINRATDTINTAASEIASGNMDLSERTEKQASSLQVTAAAMEQLTATVTQNAENARQADRMAAGASEVAQRGGLVVGNVVTTMTSINDSSKRIADIIGVIDGIAFQTNILALNAAVEAARAGEQGRGFAVVASEVRSLAQRSAEAAKEIKTLIATSVSKVTEGTKLVDEAGQTMSEIVTAVTRVSKVIAEITTASDEQSDGIAQVNDAIVQMDQATQQNAALVEQAAAAAESLKDQAQSLAQTVSVFRLDRNF
jgi:methyl-accepting chemotaxis protein